MNAWKNLGRPVNLAESGGHEVRFEERRIFPYKFLIKHYPIRSQAHGERKVFRERKLRWAAAERARGWHVQYDGMAYGHCFLKSPAGLCRFEAATFPYEFLVERLSGDCAGLARAPAAADDAPAVGGLGKHFWNPLRLLKSAEAVDLVSDELVGFIRQRRLGAKRVLEIGCRSGVTGRALKDVLGAEYYAGIDANEELVQQARGNLDQVYRAELDETPATTLGLPEESFDLLVALDVFGEFRNPWDVLADLVRLLRPGGHVLASVRNVQHFSVMAKLIQGRWLYESEGLLDVAQLRFFTCASFYELLYGADLLVKDTVAIFRPALDVGRVPEMGNPFQHGPLALSNLTRDDVIRLHTYWFISLAQRPGEGEG